MLNRLAIGRFIHEMLDDLQAYREKKLLVYSGHDSTIVPLLCAFDAYDGEPDQALLTERPCCG